MPSSGAPRGATSLLNCTTDRGGTERVSHTLPPMTDPAPMTVLAIGDSPEHDIAGAAGAGLDSVLLRTGILSDKDDASLRSRLPQGARRVFSLAELRW